MPHVYYAPILPQYWIVDLAETPAEHGLVPCVAVAYPSLVTTRVHLAAAALREPHVHLPAGGEAQIIAAAQAYVAKREV
jgi:hypothetical protein